jgi:mono/diheme cytochrome c family protein
MDLLLAALLLIQDDDDARRALPPGLLATYTGGAATARRIDPDVSFAWDRDVPDERLPAGPFAARWEGLLLVRQEGRVRFHAYLEGEVELRLDGKPALVGGAPRPEWRSGPEISVASGERAIEVLFRKTGPTARLHLFWSSESFALESIPPWLLFHAGAEPALDRVRRGGQLFASLRCGACHARPSDDPPAPALTRVADGLSPSALRAQLLRPRGRMPAFGFTEDEARAIAAFLRQASTPVTLAPLKTPDRGADRKQGERLVRTIGCLACHRVGALGRDGPWDGGDLSDVGARRSPEWLAHWLAHPEQLNPDHRMPVFKLGDDERRQIAVALSELKTEPAGPEDFPPADPDLIDRGRRLVRDARCVACHRIPGLGDPPPKLPYPSGDPARSCLSAAPDPATRRPAYAPTDTEAVAAFLASGPRSPTGTFERGRRLLERNNCLSCHERGGAGGIAPVVAGLPGDEQGLIPPSLNAVGDKLTDAALAAAVGGDAPRPRLPWLRVRMPVYRHTDAERAALVAYLVGHDRIPAPVDAPAASDARTRLIGQALAGPDGFSCIACHVLGDHAPRQVPIGTRGSDLLRLGTRMRRPYFLRWVRAPLRLAPGIEMPSHENAVPGILEERLEAQLAALWDALNDPNFRSPAAAFAVEQFFSIEPAAPARVIRDVFQLRDGPVARALAVGLNNGHNLLLDLDAYALRAWTVGDLARQRTEGKSWYWELLGTPVVSAMAPDLALRPAGAEPQLPRREHGSVGQLVRYAPDGAGLTWTYALQFADRAVEITERVVPAEGGWDRTIRASLAPDEGALWVARPAATVEAVEPVVWQTTAALGDRAFAALAPASPQQRITLRYRASVPPRPTDPPPPRPRPPPAIEPITTVPGFSGVRLPLDRSIMPTAIGWTADGTLVFTSLKGHVYRARDSDADGLEDRLTLVEEGLAAPYGIIADGNDLVVAHKPELLRLIDTDGDGRADRRQVVASGWGYTDNYHDWACGIVRDARGNLYVGLGSDYVQEGRPRPTTRWRGKVLRIGPDGAVTPVGHALRYPMGLAIDALGRIFVSDNQGDRNPFNKINRLVEGAHYGVPSLYEEEPRAPERAAAIRVPHPWTRSVNGIFFIPAGPLAGHGIGCEYDSRFLVRFTLQQVGDEVQGAVYAFSRADGPARENFVGPLCGAVGPHGQIVIGSIHDSGWLGGRNTGALEVLRPTGRLPNGIRELRATPDGFEIEFFAPPPRAAAERPEAYAISAYTRVWGGAYHTSDAERHRVTVASATVSADGRTVRLRVDRLREGFVYEVGAAGVAADLWPATGHYTMNRIPAR